MSIENVHRASRLSRGEFLRHAAGLCPLGAAALMLVCAIGCSRHNPVAAQSSQPSHEWRTYGGDVQQTRYSALEQVNRQNVQQLEVVWSFDSNEEGGLETQPIVVDRVLYAVTPKHKIVALDAATGRQLWKFDSGLESTGPNRGVTYWRGGADERIFAAVDQFLYALNARTGRPIAQFGDRGRINLRNDLGRDPRAQSVRLTSPGIAYKDLIIIGGRVSESQGASPGDVRAYDARTGRLRWAYHTIPRTGEFGYETWPTDARAYSGAANNWAGMALDERRGIVFVPTGSAAADHYGADRIGDDLFANCLLALSADTGDRIWHFQTVHHDLWDRDLPAPPSLVTVKRDGQTLDAIVQTTKQGFVFLFDRANGLPLFPIEERRFPASSVDGEQAAATQPVPVKPAPFARQSLTADLLTNRTPEAHKAALESFMKVRSEGQFVPFSVDRETIVFPGFDGGAEWGGVAVDPSTGILYVNATEMAWTGMLTATNVDKTGRGVYLSHCADCHGDDMRGAPPQIPSLVGLSGTRTAVDVSGIIREGAGRMPAFPSLDENAVAALVRYVLTGEDKKITDPDVAGNSFVSIFKRLVKHRFGFEAVRPMGSAETNMKYRFTGYKKFLDIDGYPAVVPPWGTLSAIDLNTGEYRWEVPLGEYPALAAQGLTNTGSENYGGPIVTAGGVLFIGATSYDRKFRAFDKTTGRLLWQTTLPFAGNATPATYEVDGRQYIVIAAGGGKAAAQPSGGVYVAFALPKLTTARSRD
jgi:quinoprotein glucose dehydrogenase